MDEYVTHREMDQRFSQLERAIEEAKRVADRAHERSEQIANELGAEVKLLRAVSDKDSGNKMAFTDSWKRIIGAIAMITGVLAVYLGWIRH